MCSVIKLFFGGIEDPFNLSKDHRSRSIMKTHQYFHLICLLRSQLVSYLVKGSSSVESPQICCGLWSWSRFRWVEIPQGTVEEWRTGLLLQGFRHPDLQDSLIQTCLSISYVTHYSPLNSAVPMSAFDQFQSSMLTTQESSLHCL